VKGISELELKLAETVGALNVLRGKGAPGSLNVRGTFDPDKVYSYFDIVAFNGSSWVATRDSPGDLPGSGWQLLSSAGKRGPRGERGERGPVGEPGLSGAAAPGFASWRLDAARYTATPVMSDGSLGPPLEFRSLFAQFLAEVDGH
jgi:hypothetical protein